MRIFPLTALFLVGCGSSGSLGSSSKGDWVDPLDRFVGRECIVRGFPNVLGTVRENPVRLNFGMTPDVSSVAAGTLERVDGGWLTIRQKDTTTVLINRAIVATLTFDSETARSPNRRL